MLTSMSIRSVLAACRRPRQWGCKHVVVPVALSVHQPVELLSIGKDTQWCERNPIAPKQREQLAQIFFAESCQLDVEQQVSANAPDAAYRGDVLEALKEAALIATRVEAAQFNFQNHCFSYRRRPPGYMLWYLHPGYSLSQCGPPCASPVRDARKRIGAPAPHFLQNCRPLVGLPMAGPAASAATQVLSARLDQPRTAVHHELPTEAGQ